MSARRSKKGKENARSNSMEGTGSLARMFHEGASIIGSKRSGNLFQELETRELTEEEKIMIDKRVALQRRMFAAYQKQERLRKIGQLREVYPGLTDEEAEKALALCCDREDEAAGKLANVPSFLASVRKACPAKKGLQESNKVNIPPAQEARTYARRKQPAFAEDQVFVGAFRGRGTAPQLHRTVQAAVPRKPRSVSVRNSARTTLAEAISLSDTSSEDCALSARSQDESEEASSEATISTVTDPHLYRLCEEAGEEVTSSEPAASGCGARHSSQANTPPAIRAQNLEAMDKAIAMELDAHIREVAETATAVPTIIEGKMSCPSPERDTSGRTMSEAADCRGLASRDCHGTRQRPQRKRAGRQSYRESSESEQEDWGDAEMVYKKEEQKSFSRAQVGSSADWDSHTAADKARLECGKAAARRGSEGRDGSTQAPVKAADLTAASEVHGVSRAECRNGAPQAEKLLEKQQILPPVGHNDGDVADKGKPKGILSAISARGFTTRGRVRQKSHKSATLMSVGRLRTEEGWFNHGYIFPEGFHSKVNFRSSVVLDQLCIHECSVLGEDGEFWPQPTFKVVAMDHPTLPFFAKSCTGCWSGILKRINGEINRRRKDGEDLPPPPKTAIAGPEYFGFNQAEIQEAIEALDPEHECHQYWQGKADRMSHAAGISKKCFTKTQRAKPGSKPRRKRNRDSEDEKEAVADPEIANKWSAINRHERYRNRCGGEYVDEDNPLPGWMDPITLEPLVSPAISPWGHVMGMATWKAVLSGTGKCPFTQRSLTWEQCQILTKGNIERYKGRIIGDAEMLQKLGLA